MIRGQQEGGRHHQSPPSGGNGNQHPVNVASSNNLKSYIQDLKKVA